MIIGKYRISKADERNLVLEVLFESKDKNTGETKILYKPIGWYPKVEHALEHILNSECMSAVDKESVAEVLEEIQKIRKLLEEVCNNSLNRC